MSSEVCLTGSAPQPLVQQCSGGSEVLLARDSGTYFYAPDTGQPSRRKHLNWSEPLQVGGRPAA